ncbi:hypothetical protein CAAN1_01S11232 [[Candida] anglica]|uniref:Fork-head domain-containing protein n=1 Tax=[Candida] anglica TaxID=148631 RepID=A0ABP0ELN1_9ASCO
MSLSRIPLQEYSNTYNSLTETPTTKTFLQSSAITTPPGTTTSFRKKRLSIDTPISKNVDNTSTKMSGSILLSPAFSSPQQQKQPQPHNFHPFQNQHPQSLQPGYHQHGVALDVPPPKPSFDTEPTNNVQRKKIKKARKDAKDSPFNLDSTDKPPYSYATLIGMSILSNPEKKLTLSQIYSWISDTFKYYKREDVGWQNSIRHNLSLNKAFVKGEKSKDGKGHFWCIQEGCEDQFLKSRSSKKHSYQEIMDQIYNSAKPGIENGMTESTSSDSTSNVTSNPKGRSNIKSINSIPSSPNMSLETDSLTEDDTKSSKNKRGSSFIEEAADYDSEHEHDDFKSILDPPTKRSKLMSASTGDGTLDTIPNLGAPFLQWGSSSDTPQFVVSESPYKPLLAGKNLTYTSSFSCNSNLELSPIRPSETGPLLEPLTPVNNVYKNSTIPVDGYGIHHSINPQLHSNLHYHCGSGNSSQLPSILPNSVTSGSSGIPTTSNSTSTGSTNIPSNSSHAQHNSSTSQSLLHPTHIHTQHHHVKTPKSNIKTPLRILKTPQTSSILKKLWNSPSYLEEFYYSPLITSSHGVLNSYDDDDLMLRAFESPAAKRLYPMNSTIGTSRKLFGEFKKVELTSTNENTEKSTKQSTNNESK